jgi:hypothetical protein
MLKLLYRIGVMSLLLLSFFLVQPPAGHLLPASGPVISSTWGGKCQDCNAIGCVGAFCREQTYFYFKQVPTLATKLYCFDVGVGMPETTECSSSDPQDCYKYYQCTDSNCTDCTYISSEKVDTVCSVGGGVYCVGGG